MNIRPYQSADRGQVVALWNEAFDHPTGRNEPHGSIDRKVAIRDELFFVAVEGEQIVGTAMAGYDGHRGWLYSIAVARHRRRGGIGTKLIRHAVDALTQRGCPKINLQILAENADTVAFYESLGFQIEERISMGKIIAP